MKQREMSPIKEYLVKFVGKSKEDILIFLGPASHDSDEEIWFYNLYKNLFFRKEIVLFFEKGKVVDLMFSKYVLGHKISEYAYMDKFRKMMKL